MRLPVSLLALPLLLGGCGGDDFDSRYERQQQAMNRQAADIDRAMANEMAGAREAERATAQAGADENASTAAAHD